MPLLAVRPCVERLRPKRPAGKLPTARPESAGRATLPQSLNPWHTAPHPQPPAASTCRPTTGPRPTPAHLRLKSALAPHQPHTRLFVASMTRKFLTMTALGATARPTPHRLPRQRAAWSKACACLSLAQEHGTPLFVYSKAAMLSALAAYQRGFAGRQAQICYAMKANSSLAVLQVFARPVAALTSSRAASWPACWPLAATRPRSFFRAWAKPAPK